jgi:hypothetical protein
MGRRFDRIAGAAAGVLLVSAIVTELRKPPEERTGHGRVFGIPYDFRRPTLDKVRRAFWDPENPALFTPHAFGVGYSVNLATLMPPQRDLRPPTRT